MRFAVAAVLLTGACGRIDFDTIDAAGPCDHVAVGESCTSVDGCKTGVTTCSNGQAACSVTGATPIGVPCGTGGACDGIGGCADSTVESYVTCNLGPETGDQLCQRAGFAGAVIANGYHWYQCAGSAQWICPEGWDAQQRCDSWCGYTDCSGVPYCGTGNVVTELLGGATTVFDPAAPGPPCGGYNPGWLVRLVCRQ